jgi:hypothetical protein
MQGKEIRWFENHNTIKPFNQFQISTTIPPLPPQGSLKGDSGDLSSGEKPKIP